MIQFDRVSKRYPNGKDALSKVSFTLPAGQLTFLTGHSGAGKSTLFKLLFRFYDVSSGDITIDGQSVRQVSQRSLRRQIGVVPQEFNFSQFEKVFDIVVTQAGFYGIPAPLARQRAEKYLRKLGLWDKRKNQARSLSGGMKRRLMIARALVHEPELLILDEPTAGVDIELRRSMWDFLIGLNNEGRTIILTTHYLEEAESLCRRIAIIDHGRIVENTDMKSLLEKLQVETFILDLARPVDHAPELPGFEVHLRDAGTLEVAVPKTQSLNRLFVALAEQNFEVMSMRNKANRLEELFVRLVEQNLPEQNPQRENAP